jgi:hypothetical protein
VVNDPTQLGPSLVTEVKYSSLTILHHSHSVTEGFYISHRFRERGVHNIEGFQLEGALQRLYPFDLVKEKGIWRVHPLRYLSGGHSTFLGPFVVYFGGVLIYCESGTIPLRGRAQYWSGSTHGKGPSFVL